MAEKLGMTDASELLGETLAEEEQADEKLTAVAEALYGQVQTGEEAEEDAEEDVEEDSATQARSRRASTKKRKR